MGNHLIDFLSVYKAIPDDNNLYDEFVVQVRTRKAKISPI